MPVIGATEGAKISDGMKSALKVVTDANGAYHQHAGSQLVLQDQQGA